MAAYPRDVLARLGVAPSRTRLVFTGHTIPTAMAAACDYEAELLEASTLVAERVAPTRPPHDLALLRAGAGRPRADPGRRVRMPFGSVGLDGDGARLA